MDQALERVLAEGFLADIERLPVADLRAARADCKDVETKCSYLRRLIQGHHDVLSGELRRRSEGGAPDDVTALVEKLPEILADRVRGPGAGRLTPTMTPGDLSGELVERIDAITAKVPLDGFGGRTDADLQRLADELAAMESEVSGLRRSLFDRIDAIEDELTKRYRDGSASVDDLLAGQEPVGG